MTNRKLAYIIKDQAPLVLPEGETVQKACSVMLKRRVGCVLVADRSGQLSGIFTGRDAVRLLAKPRSDGATLLAKAMTRAPATIAPESRAIDALQAMTQGHFRHMPVISEGKIRGIVSRGDFKGMEFETLKWCEHGCVSEPNRKISAIIRGQDLLVFTSDENVQRACKAMSDRKYGSTLVTDVSNRLSGIFTGRDAVRLLADAQKTSSQCALGEAMTEHPKTISPEHSAVDALRLMSEGGFRHLPVIDNDKIVGIVSRSDFTGCEIDRLDEEQHLYECLW